MDGGSIVTEGVDMHVYLIAVIEQNKVPVQMRLYMCLDDGSWV